jgi:hypothetical protein
MSLAIGLCGGHRVGKTTLAKAYADHAAIPFVQTSTTAVFQQHGLDPAQALDFAKRLWIQEHVLSAAEAVWKTSAHFITDRTPIDFMAYTLGDIQGVTEVDSAALETYLNHCFAATAKYFRHLIIIQPGIELVYESGKAALNIAYIEHLNTLALGLCHDPRQRCPVQVMGREILNLRTRVTWLDKAISP